MKKQLLTGIVLLVVVGCGTSPEKKAEQLFDEAIALADRFEFDRAQDKFTQLSEIDPQSPMGYYGSGLILEQQLQYHDALHIYMVVARNNPSFAPAHAGCWRVFHHLEEYQRALEAALAYNEAEPYEVASKLRLAGAFVDVGQALRARKFLDTALELGGDPALIDMMQAWALAAANRPDSASDAFQRGLQYASPSAAVWAAASRYLEASGLIDSAVVLSRKAAELSDREPRRWVQHVYLTLRHNYFYEARKAIGRLKAAQAPDVIVSGLETQYHFTRRAYTDSRHALDIYLRHANYSVSGYITEMIVRTPIGDELTIVGNADMLNALMVKKNYDPDFAELIDYWTAMIVSNIHDDLVGLDRLQKLPQKFTMLATCGLREAFCYYRTGQHEEFEKRIERISRFHGRQPEWLVGLADIFGNRFVYRWEDAAEYYGKVLQLDPWHRQAFDHWVALHRRLEETDKALALFDTYPHFSERYPECRLTKGVCLVEAGQTTEGLELFLEHYPAVKGDIQWADTMLAALDDQADDAATVRLAEWLSEHNVENPDALTLAAFIQAKNKHFEIGIEAAEAAVDREPENLMALAVKAQALYHLGKTEEALEILEANVAADEFHIESNYWLARILATEGMDPHRAANLARRAVFDSNSALRPWLNLSYVYLQVGRYDLARGEALKASRSYAGDPEAVFRLGMAMYMEGKEEAGEKLREAIELGLRGDNLREAEETLRKL